MKQKYNFSEKDLRKLGLKEIIKSDQKLIKSKFVDASRKVIVKPKNEGQEVNPNWVAYKLGLITFDELRRLG